jgi:hypothetical protein
MHFDKRIRPAVGADLSRPPPMYRPLAECYDILIILLNAMKYSTTLRGGLAMGTLILNSLEINSFRAFEHLQIERLGRVNLIVGKNNVGKTSLLEAIQL